MARPRSNIRDRIIRAARVEFLKIGVDASSLRAIARRARTNLGMIYYYFPTKDDLFLAVIEAPYQHIVATFADALGGDAPIRERIRALFRRIGSFTPEEAETFRLVISEGIKSPERRAAVFARAWRGHLPIVFAAIEGGKHAGHLDKTIPTPLLGLITAAVGVLPQIAARALPMGLTASEALADRLCDVLFEGIGA
ncbi:MAG TPA: TetR/AcrR family transcriptional regulator [Kofleriaceae bacterium]|nr:TetR/AcrR family transcriptional regulator [Kofleriaceae bacterium]